MLSYTLEILTGKKNNQKILDFCIKCIMHQASGNPLLKAKLEIEKILDKYTLQDHVFAYTSFCYYAFAATCICTTIL